MEFFLLLLNISEKCKLSEIFFYYPPKNAFTDLTCGAFKKLLHQNRLLFGPMPIHTGRKPELKFRWTVPSMSVSNPCSRPCLSVSMSISPCQFSCTWSWSWSFLCPCLPYDVFMFVPIFVFVVMFKCMFVIML